MSSYETTEGQTSQRLKQLSIFLENRLGELLKISRVLEAQDVNICAVAISDAADHAVVRLLVDRPTLAAAALAADGYYLITTDLLGVALPANKPGGMRRVLQALLRAELNVHYIYAVATRGTNQAVLALHVEDNERAARVLIEQGIPLIGQDELL
ncbi:MAG: amino acid-binding protein [Planctomycetota bacterium]